MISYKLSLNLIVSMGLMLVGCNDENHATSRKFADSKNLSIDKGSSGDVTEKLGEEEFGSTFMGEGVEELLKPETDEANASRSLDGIATEDLEIDTDSMVRKDPIPELASTETAKDPSNIDASDMTKEQKEDYLTSEVKRQPESATAGRSEPESATTAKAEAASTTTVKIVTVAEKTLKEACINAIPIHRWYQPSTGNHFYTPHASKACVGKTKAHSACNGETVNEAKYQYEKIEFWVQKQKSDLTQEVHRFMNQTTGDHIYTIGQIEIATLKDSKHFNLEKGGNFHTFKEKAGGAIPIYRWLRNVEGPIQDHMYTVSAYPGCQNKTNPHKACGEGLSSKDQYEGIIGYGYANKPDCSN